MTKISAVYQIVNLITNDRYVGSSKNVFHRWAAHKCPSSWKRQPNHSLYLDMQKYGIENFRFQILAPVMPECLKQVEQEFIGMIHPTYNNVFAKGRNIERRKESKKEYRQSDKGKEINRKQARKDMKKYYNQLCSFRGETLTLNTLAGRFYKAGIEHPTLEAKKCLLDQ